MSTIFMGIFMTVMLVMYQFVIEDTPLSEIFTLVNLFSMFVGVAIALAIREAVITVLRRMKGQRR